VSLKDATRRVRCEEQGVKCCKWAGRGWSLEEVSFLFKYKTEKHFTFLRLTKPESVSSLSVPGCCTRSRAPLSSARSCPSDENDHRSRVVSAVSERFV
jgi:hypothetical protein